MTTRYSITVGEVASDHDAELCQVDSNPKSIAQAAAAITISKGCRVRRYERVWIVDHAETRPESSTLR